MDLLKASLPANEFFGNGPEMGPTVLMTDNCAELRDAILKTWPRTTHVLCIFHVLQQVWRWLHDKKHCIQSDDRPHLLLLFKNVLYSEKEEEMEERFEYLLNDTIVCKYHSFQKYTRDVYTDRQMWALAFRNDLPISGNNTNSYCESQFLVIKDEILKRQKEVNVVALVDKLTNEFDQHYKNKLLSVASGKFDGIYSERFKGKSKRKHDGVGYQIPSKPEQDLALQHLEALGRNTYLMRSFTLNNVSYVVDMNLGMCECENGMDGSACKHQYVLWANSIANCSNFIPVFNKAERRQFAEIALGNSLSLPYYEGLHERILNTPTASELGLDTENTTEHKVSNSKNSIDRAMERRNQQIDLITKEECEKSLSDLFKFLTNKLHTEDQNYFRNYFRKFLTVYKTCLFQDFPVVSIHLVQPSQSV